MAPRFQIFNITDIGTQNSTPSPFISLQDAFDTRYSGPGRTAQSPSLFADACQQDDVRRNCTIACLNNTQTFASLKTLHNCVVWPSVVARDRSDGLVPVAAELATSLGLEDSPQSSLPSNISERIQRCLLDSCAASEEGASNANETFLPGFQKRFSRNLTGNAYYGFDDSLPYFEPCGYFDAPVTADVTGIGLAISYGMQMGLALLAFVSAVPWKAAVCVIHNVAQTICNRLRGNKNAADGSKSSRASNLARMELAKKHNKHAPTSAPALAIIPAVVGFQKAQCYFMLATNIASLVVQHDGGLGPKSYQQLYNTYIFIKVIAIGGYLPITFGLLILQMLKKVGWYLLSLSIASVGVAIGNLYIERFFKPSAEDLEELRQRFMTGGPSSCGEHNPLAWCYIRIGLNHLYTLVLVIIEHFWNSSDHTNTEIRNIIFRSCIRRPRGDRPGRWESVARWSWKYVVPVVFVILIPLHLYCFAVFFDDLNWFLVNEIYDSSWGFGQILAISIGAPPLIEYLLEIFRGIENGSDHRLPHGYGVRKKDDKGRDGPEHTEKGA